MVFLRYPRTPGSKNGIVEYTPEFSAMVRRRILQRELSTQPLPEVEPLREVRKLRKRSRADVAAHLGIKQTVISALEKQPDALVSTVARYVEALGGTLDLVARFPGLHVRLRLGPGQPHRGGRNSIANPG